MAKETVLVVEDENDILELVSHNLQREGYSVHGVVTGEEAIDALPKVNPNVVILDLMLPGIDGLEVCRIFKNDSRSAHIPVVILTAKGEEADVVAGLEMGADDYITKPFSPRVLLARVKAVLRRKSSEPPSQSRQIVKHGINIHPGKHEVTVNNQVIDLTPTEFKILHFLARHPGWVFTRYQIVDGIREDETVVTDRSVDVQIVGLRRKLGESGSVIETVRGVGYRFRDE